MIKNRLQQRYKQLVDVLQQSRKLQKHASMGWYIYCLIEMVNFFRFLNTYLSHTFYISHCITEYVVAESVVVIKKLLQTQATEHNDILKQMAKLLDFITVPAARAAILWLIGEYNDRVPKIAPDVLRKAAKTFADEQNIVKLQILNLAVKLYVHNPTQIQLLCQYIFNLARYDQNYDIRCRARLLKQFVFPTKDTSVLTEKMKDIFLASKPAPALESKYKEREQYQLGSMSHYLNQRVNGYQDLPPFPEMAPDNTVRNVEPPTQDKQVSNDHVQASGKHKTKVKNDNQKNKKHSFYSEESEDKSSSEDSSDESSETGSGSANGSGPDSKKDRVGNGKESTTSEEESSSSDDDSSDSSESDDESDSSDATVENESENIKDSKDVGKPKSGTIKNGQIPVVKKSQPDPKPQKSNLDLLLDLEDFAPVATPLMTPSLGGFLSPMTSGLPNAPPAGNSVELIGPSFIPFSYAELLNKVNGFGLGVTYRYTRSPHLVSAYMVSIELLFTNHGSLTLRDIKVGKTTLPNGVVLSEFSPIENLEPKQIVSRILGIDFNDSTQSLSFEIVSDAGTSKVTTSATVGAFLRAVTMSSEYFKIERTKLRGMTEHTGNIPINIDAGALKKRIFEIANVGTVASAETNVLLFAGHTMNSRSLVLITVKLPNENEVEITVNCEKMVIGSILLNEIKSILKT